MERGLTMQELKRMQLGDAVTFIEDYNDRQKKAEKAEEKKKNMKHYRFATPEETSAFTRG